MRRFGVVIAPAILAALLMGWQAPAAAQGGGAPKAGPAGGDDRPTRHEIWDEQGSAQKSRSCRTISSITACGTNGRPAVDAAHRLEEDYRRCRPEPSALREVYFRYDDELEYWAKANDLGPQMEQYIGTKTYGFPITVSVLIGEDATVRGIRIVSDPRDPSGDRDEAYLLRNFLNARFSRDGWQCNDLPADTGETPVSGLFIKQNCTIRARSTPRLAPPW